MPKIKNYTLEKLCLDFIVENMQNLCKTSPLIGPSSSGTVSDTTLDRFYPLRKHKLDRILKYLEGKCFLTKTFLENVITSELCYLKLIGFFETETCELLTIASARCPDLLVLKLHGNLNDDVLCQCLPKFRKLQELTIQDENIHDSFLEEIGAQCGNLQYLNLSFCSITDSGIMVLCYNVTDQFLKKIPRDICKSLRTIDLQGTKVTLIGIKTALSYLLELKSLIHENTVEAIAEMTIYAEKNSPSVQMFSLTALSILSSYRDGSLPTALDVCHFITKLEITAVAGLNNKDLQFIYYLEYLVDLKITSYEIGGEITFTRDRSDYGIIPLLFRKGRFLESLEISCFRDVNFYSVVQLCPNLKKLLLKDNNYSSQTSDDQSCDFKRQKMDEILLKKLEEICLVDCDEEDGCITRDMLTILLSSPFLKKIVIWKCDELNDEIILNANTLHHFRYLELVEFHECNLLNDLAVDILLQTVNPLDTVVLDSCLNLTHAKCDGWKCEVRLRNLDLFIKYEEREVSEDVEEDDEA